LTALSVAGRCVLPSVSRHSLLVWFSLVQDYWKAVRHEQFADAFAQREFRSLQDLPAGTRDK